MITTDPIADLLTRIRNAYMAGKESLVIPHSKTKVAILEVMKKRNFIHDYKEAKGEKFPEINVTLSENRQGITLKRISKPGQRIYVKSGSLTKINGGLGVAIVSTPKGIMSAEEAKKANIGGELMCEIY
ncbi:MAG: 30S ribosomal protein S8 [Candidatus Gracilibacteria bacterium]|nr:30S ribosomal protein S8 [Candidatus Peregrinibacteria bacterium]HMR00907.1 30S ribosomal protein S8 [Candidatus Gracilibacteria bacterium]